jgi:hypothetical protein
MFWMIVAATYRSSVDDTKTLCTYFHDTPSVLLHSSQVDDLIERTLAKLHLDVETFESQGSDWVLSWVDYLDVHVARYEPVHASSYTPLPSYIRNKKAVVNPKNNDNKCFMWAVLAALYPASRNPDRISNYYAYESSLNFENIDFPVRIDDIQQFADLNNLSINVYTYDSDLYPIYLCPTRKLDHVNLLVYEDHYSCIRSMDRLLGDQTKHNGRGYYCDTCLFPFFTEERLLNHRPNCRNVSMTKIEMPEKDKAILQFSNVHKMLRKPLVVYSDFECILQSVARKAQCTQSSFTERYQKHVPCASGLVVSISCCDKPKFRGLSIDTATNPARDLLEKLIGIAENDLPSLCSKPLAMTAADEQMFVNSTMCDVCDLELATDRVRDHCHVCGKFRSALHAACNQKLRLGNEVVVVMHNLRRYDSHIIMQEIGNVCVDFGLDIQCCARGMEDYVTFCVSNKRRDGWRIRFIDSVQFLSASLEKLVEILPKSELHAMRQYFEAQHVDLLCRKQVFPYDELDSWEKMSHSGMFDPEKFFNSLNGTHISKADYEHYVNVYNTFGIKSFKEYMELYLKTDVLLLADVFE